MAVLAEAGTLYSATTTGTPTYTLKNSNLNTQAFLFMGNHATNGETGSVSQFFGCAVGAYTGESAGWSSWNDVTGSRSRIKVQHANPVSLINPATDALVRMYDASINSVGTGSFSLNWATASAQQFPVNYLILGGDVTSASAQVTYISAAGRIAVSSSFTPDAVILFGSSVITNNPIPPTFGTSSVSIGWATRSPKTSGSYSSFYSQDNIALTKTSRKQAQNRIFNSMVFTGTPATEIAIASFDINGYTLSCSKALFGYALGIAFKGGLWYAGQFNGSTHNGDQVIVGPTFQPKAIIVSSVENVTSGVANTGGKMMIGFAAWNSASNSASCADTDEPSGADCTSPPILHTDYSDYTNLITCQINGKINAQAYVKSYNTNGFTLNWTTTDGTAREFNYLCVGDATLPASMPWASD